MEIYVEQHPSRANGCSLLVLGYFEADDGAPRPATDTAFSQDDLVQAVVASGEFRAKPREARVVHLAAGDGPSRIMLLGLGKREELELEGLRRSVGSAARTARDCRSGDLAFTMPIAAGLPIEEQARTAVEGVILALYRFERYRAMPEDDDVEVRRLTLVLGRDATEATVGAAASDGKLLAESQCFCRDLGNTPGLDATPSWMAEQARDLADEFGLICTVIEQEEMEARGMGGILGVARGSDEPPMLVVLEHRGAERDLPTICLVGKGITFDSGGISIKPAENMGDMKFDKSGACVVLAAMRAVAGLNLPLRVVGITPLAENMPSGKSYRPGDVLTISNGKTIEVLNTDAEGRLVLADALVHAVDYDPEVIIDLATLTGACVIALGKHCAGLLASDDTVAEALTAAGESCGERVWRLPLFPEYKEQIKSDIADMKNLGGREAGTITAACLLAEFVDGRPWAHLDIAGVSWRDTDRDYLTKGGTGFGVRLLLDYLRNYGG